MKNPIRVASLKPLELIHYIAARNDEDGQTIAKFWIDAVENKKLHRAERKLKKAMWIKNWCRTNDFNIRDNAVREKAAMEYNKINKPQ